MQTFSIFAYIVVLGGLLGLSAFFAGAETVFFSLNRTEMAKFRNSKKGFDKQVVYLLSKPKDFLVTILFGNELTNIAISVLIAGFFYRIFGDQHIKLSTFTSVAVGTFMILLFGEVIPKSIGVRFAPALAPPVAFLLSPLYTFLKPFRFLLVKFANLFIKIFGGTKVAQTPLILEEELREILELGTKSGAVDVAEQEMIHKAFSFASKTAQSIMTPMNQVFLIKADLPYEELLAQIKATQFSRIPFRAANDDQIIGFLYIKDLFRFDKLWHKDNIHSIKEILRPPLFVQKNASLEEVLEAFRLTRIHMAMVVDENQKTIGILTMHDIVEELFGEVEL